MYVTQQKEIKPIILLILINIIIICTVLVNPVIAYYDDTPPNINESITSEIVDKDEMIGSITDTVEYEIVEGETIVVSKVQAIKIERLKEEALERKREEERQARIKAMKTVETSREVSASSITIHTDLSIMNTITADEINVIIDYWDSKMKGTTPFKGKGQVFIDAAKQSGLDPIYILSHAALESSWGKKDMSHNYFGIGAYDNDPLNGHNYGNNSFENGIINGAIWISEKYYDKGQTTLYSMRYNDGKHEYCTSSTWAPDISSIMRTSYSLIK